MAAAPGGFVGDGSPRIDAVIHNWLLDRQELIRQLAAIASAGPSASIDAFRDVLVDYISAGHFEVFMQLEAEAKAFDLSGIQLLNALYPYIQQSTDAALVFNEHFNVMAHSEAQAALLRSELSELGELLTDRFQLEDQLIDFVHNPAARIPYQ